jgi:hypothetical protein
MNTEHHIPDLLRQLRDDTTTLVREEIALAKTELSEKLAATSRNAAYLAGGAMIAFSALLLLLMGFAYLLGHAFVSRGTEPGAAAFLGFVIVAVAVGAISATLIMKALKTLRGDTLKPEKTVRSLREDKQWAQSKIS